MLTNGEDRVRLSRWKEFLFLLRREFQFQLDGRSSYPRGVYPGVNWFALLCGGAMLLEFNSSRFAPESSSSAADHFIFLTLAQAFLIALRSTVYCAISMSRDLQNHTAAVVRISPVSRTLTLIAKLCACLTPLWIELFLYAPAGILFFSVYLSLPMSAVTTVLPFLFALSLVAGCLGLTIGSTNSNPLHAGRNARLFVFFLLLFMPMLQVISQGWTVPLAALALWLSATTRRTPHRTIVLVGTAAMVFALGTLSGLSEQGFTSSLLHPISSVGHYLGYALRGEAYQVYIDLPLFVSLIYLVLSAFLFLLARARFQYAR